MSGSSEAFRERVFDEDWDMRLSDGDVSTSPEALTVLERDGVDGWRA